MEKLDATEEQHSSAPDYQQLLVESDGYKKVS